MLCDKLVPWKIGWGQIGPWNILAPNWAPANQAHYVINYVKNGVLNCFRQLVLHPNTNTQIYKYSSLQNAGKTQHMLRVQGNQIRAQFALNLVWQSNIFDLTNIWLDKFSHYLTWSVFDLTQKGFAHVHSLSALQILQISDSKVCCTLTCNNLLPGYLSEMQKTDDMDNALH